MQSVDNIDPKNDKNDMSATRAEVPPWAYPLSYYHAEEEEINLLDYWKVIKKRKKQILLLIVLIVLLTLVVSLRMKKQYSSEVTLMPLSSSGGGGLASMAAQFNSIPILGDSIGAKLGANKSKELNAILQSNALAERVINKSSLMPVIFPSRWNAETKSFTPDKQGQIPIADDAIGFFQKKIVQITTDKKTDLIKIKIKFSDPQLAALIANTMALELQDFVTNNTLTSAKRNRLFIEGQLVKAREALLISGRDYNRFYGKNQISSVIPELDIDVGSFIQPPRVLEEFRRATEKTVEAKDFLPAPSEHTENISGNDYPTIKVKDVPSQVYLQYLTLNQEILAKTYALWTQQYEMAKIEEAKEDLSFQVLDAAKVPRGPSSPRLKLNLAAALLGGLFFSVFVAFLREGFQKQKEKETA